VVAVGIPNTVKTRIRHRHHARLGEPASPARVGASEPDMSWRLIRITASAMITASTGTPAETRKPRENPVASAWRGAVPAEHPAGERAVLGDPRQPDHPAGRAPIRLTARCVTTVAARITGT
jgi:hypothetical protein